MSILFVIEIIKTNKNIIAQQIITYLTMSADHRCSLRKMNKWFLHNVSTKFMNHYQESDFGGCKYLKNLIYITPLKKEHVLQLSHGNCSKK